MTISNWKELLNQFFNNLDEFESKRDKELSSFWTSIVIPAFHEIEAELSKRQKTMEISSGPRVMYQDSIGYITVNNPRGEEFRYEIKVEFPLPPSQFQWIPHHGTPTWLRAIRIEDFINDFLHSYIDSQWEQSREHFTFYTPLP